MSRLFPWTIGFLGIILGLVQLYRDLTGWRHQTLGGIEKLQMDEVAQNQVPTRVEVQRVGALMGILVGAVFVVWWLGFSIAMPIFVLVYMRFEARESWLPVLLMTGITILFVTVLFEQFLQIPWPKGILWYYFGMV